MPRDPAESSTLQRTIDELPERRLTGCAKNIAVAGSSMNGTTTCHEASFVRFELLPQNHNSLSSTFKVILKYSIDILHKTSYFTYII